jgi:hypothetical protein
MQIQPVIPTINNCNNNFDRNLKKYVNLNFTSTPKVDSGFFKPIQKLISPLKSVHDKFMNNLTNKISEIIIKVLEKPSFEKAINKIKNVKNLISHLTVLTSAVLSGFYIKKTLENDNLDEKNRRTLAINQAAVTVLSTGLSYWFDSLAKEKIDTFTTKFLQKNVHETPANLEKYKSGIKTASSIMIFMTVYRFIAPVFVTPIANYIGNKINEKENKNKIGEKK